MGEELPVMRPREVASVLGRTGWQIDRQRGSHLILVNADIRGIVTVPMHRGDLPPGTLRSIIKQAGLTVGEFNALREDR